MPAQIYQENDRGKSVELTVGTRFSIQLQENPTTGYKWGTPTFDPNCLELERDEYTPAAGAGIGGGGVRQFWFLVKGVCNTTVHLAYKRPWERDVAPEATFSITIMGTRQ
jgi:inhibitor of cysteine peptidase